MTTLVLLLSVTHAYASNYSLTKRDISKFDERKISYSYGWNKVKNIDKNLKDILNLSSKDNHLRILGARFVFYIPGSIERFDSSFYSKKKTLDDLSGMSHKQIGNNKYKVKESKMGISISAEVGLTFNVDYDKYQREFGYTETAFEGFISHQKARRFSNYFRSTDIITHLAQDGDHVKVTMDSFATLSKKPSKGIYFHVLKGLIVNEIKSKALDVPLVYLRK
ncbi:hypothetical protein [Halobacteriovorax sp.]|uniref:hypothetical protein n=1 Tax=Halobacteriovorax sp. TaxID=2020862 RepID=UPI003569FC1B